MKTKSSPAKAKAANDISMVDLTALLGGATGSASDKPVVPDADGSLAKLADEAFRIAEQMEGLDGQLKTIKADLVHASKRFYFRHCQGKAEVPSSLEVHGVKNKILVVMQNRYGAVTDTDAVKGLVGAEYTDLFQQEFVIKVDGTEIPEANRATLIAEMQALFKKHNATGALSAKSEIKPTAKFHTARHAQFDEATNTALDKFAPMVAAVKTKAVK